MAAAAGAPLRLSYVLPEKPLVALLKALLASSILQTVDAAPTWDDVFASIFAATGAPNTDAAQAAAAAFTQSLERVLARASYLHSTAAELQAYLDGTDATPANKAVIVAFWRDARDAAHATLQRRAVWRPQLVSVAWRVHTATAAGNASVTGAGAAAGATAAAAGAAPASSTDVAGEPALLVELGIRAASAGAGTLVSPSASSGGGTGGSGSAAGGPGGASASVLCVEVDKVGLAGMLASLDRLDKDLAAYA
jgi:hypothetical protein